jgi:hypothetical protein
VSACALTNDYASDAAHFVSPRFAAFHDVPGCSKPCSFRDLHANSPRWNEAWTIAGTMTRTLFDVDDAFETTTHAHRSAGPGRRDAIVPVRLTRGERDQLAEVARDLGISLSTYERVTIDQFVDALLVHVENQPRASAEKIRSHLKLLRAFSPTGRRST